jgi:hypothetical protein
MVSNFDELSLAIAQSRTLQLPKAEILKPALE